MRRDLSEDVVQLLRIRGRVQGVGYRAFVQEQALRLDLSGWTRNRSDGAVEALVGGEKGAIEKMIALLHRGPPGAHVAAIETRDAASEALNGYRGNFTILPTR
jgi:acylphosphatase